MEVPHNILRRLAWLWGFEIDDGDESRGSRGLSHLFPVEERPRSAQQTMWILSTPPMQDSNRFDQYESSSLSCESTSFTSPLNEWQASLERGNGFLVVRQWISSRGWWNCNFHATAATLPGAARSEVSGYRLAYEGLAPSLDIPRVLLLDSDSAEKPWAVMEYVGKLCQHFSSTASHIEWDTEHLDSMIPVRDEFGFEEPHPRWGRLPVEKCQDYGELLIDQVLEPLHRQWHTTRSHPILDIQRPDGGRGFRYRDMVERYKALYTSFLVDKINSEHQHRFDKEIRSLAKVLCRLQSDAKQSGLWIDDSEAPMPPCVPCHMDLQPQNLVFGRSSSGQMHLVSLLDWEDAAFADCRFEILMICRKVLANSAQAFSFWKRYEEKLGIPLGPLDPWLNLETAHSIITLLLQALVGGGRTPWERQTDIAGKIERELIRLSRRGWIVEP